MSGAAELRLKLERDFPGRELIGKAEAAAWMGISKKTLTSRYRLPPGGLVSKAALFKTITTRR